MKILPLNQNLLVQIKSQEKTKGGIILVEDKLLEEAEVLAVAKDVQSINVGDIILMKDYTTDKVTLEGTDYHFIKEENVLAIKK